MKKTIVASLAVVFGVLHVQAQENWYDHVEVEVSAGYQFVLNGGNLSHPSSDSFGAYKLGLRAPIDEDFGVRVTYERNPFRSANYYDVDMDRVTAELTYSIPMDCQLGDGTFGVIAHAGMGYGQLKSSNPAYSSTDRIAVAQIGVMPQYNISKNIAIFLDLTYSFNTSQDYTFTGVHNGSQFTSQLLIPSIGVSFKPFQ